METDDLGFLGIDRVGDALEEGTESGFGGRVAELVGLDGADVRCAGVYTDHCLKWVVSTSI